MNIFYLDTDPKLAAKYHCDKHVVKMILETAQLLCTAHRVLDGTMETTSINNRKRVQYTLDETRETLFYKSTHVNHPSSIWTRETKGNYLWLYELFKELCNEYTFRYGKVHLSEIKLLSVLGKPPINMKDSTMTLMPQAMPDYCKMTDSVQAYRNYYLKEKVHILIYTKREKPDWLI